MASLQKLIQFWGKTSDYQQQSLQQHTLLTYKRVSTSASPMSSCTMKKVILPWNKNFLEIKFTWAASHLCSPGTELNWGYLFFTVIIMQMEKQKLYKCYLLFNGRVQLYSFCHLKEYSLMWPSCDCSARKGTTAREHNSVQGISSLNEEIPSYTYLQWTDLSDTVHGAGKASMCMSRQCAGVQRPSTFAMLVWSKWDRLSPAGLRCPELTLTDCAGIHVCKGQQPLPRTSTFLL